MKSWIKNCLFVLLSITLSCMAASLFAYTATHIKKSTWSGEKWEYLVENPHVNHVDPALFEEVLDTAGHDGWELINVSAFNHFYTFYFKRPLLPHKVEAHLYRLKRNKKLRAQQDAEKRVLIQKTLKNNK